MHKNMQNWALCQPPPPPGSKNLRHPRMHNNAVQPTVRVQGVEVNSLDIQGRDEGFFFLHENHKQINHSCTPPKTNMSTKTGLFQ